jgi:hypothetical protein
MWGGARSLPASRRPVVQPYLLPLRLPWIPALARSRAQRVLAPASNCICCRSVAAQGRPGIRRERVRKVAPEVDDDLQAEHAGYGLEAGGRYPSFA